MTTMVHLSPVRWRLLNALTDAPAPVNAAALLTGQQAGTDDLRYLAESGLVDATLATEGILLDLAEHLTHGGAVAVVALALNSRGRRAAQVPRNRILRRLADGATLGLHTLLVDAGADESDVIGLCQWALLTAAVRATGEPITAEQVRLLPAATVTVRLSSKGRDYLPRPAAEQPGPGSVTTPELARTAGPFGDGDPRQAGWSPDHPGAESGVLTIADGEERADVRVSWAELDDLLTQLRWLDDYGSCSENRIDCDSGTMISWSDFEEAEDGSVQISLYVSDSTGFDGAGLTLRPQDLGPLRNRLRRQLIDAGHGDAR